MVQQAFENISDDQWDAIKVKFAHEADVQISGDAGSGDTHGVNFAWSMDHASHILTTKITSISWKLKALGLTESSVLGKFTAWINEARA